MKFKKLIQFCMICAVGSVVMPAEAQQTVAGLPPLHVDGRFLVYHLLHSEVAREGSILEAVYAILLAL